jgi:hypothetical protein
MILLISSGVQTELNGVLAIGDWIAIQSSDKGADL